MLDRPTERKEESDRVRKARTFFQQRSCKSLSSPGLLFPVSVSVASLSLSSRGAPRSSSNSKCYTYLMHVRTYSRTFVLGRAKFNRVHRGHRLPINALAKRPPAKAIGSRLPFAVCCQLAPLAGCSPHGSRFSFTLVAVSRSRNLSLDRRAMPMNDRFVQCGAHALAPVPTHRILSRVTRQRIENELRMNVHFKRSFERK